MADIAKSNGINFVPLYSPCKKYSSNRTADQQVEFTDEEMKHFKRRFEEGYDVPGDTHYIQWLKIHHPECNTPHLANPSRTMECHNTHPDSVNYDNINYSTSIPSSPDSNKELTVQDLSS